MWRRAAFREIAIWMESPPGGRALLLSGARQVGKKTLFLQAIDELLAQGAPPPGKPGYGPPAFELKANRAATKPRNRIGLHAGGISVLRRPITAFSLWRPRHLEILAAECRYKRRSARSRDLPLGNRLTGRSPPAGACPPWESDRRTEADRSWAWHRGAVTEENAGETARYVAEQCAANGRHYVIGLEPDKPEDITDLEKALNPSEPARSEKISRNDPCPCGSGRKYKKCCGMRAV